MFGDNPSYLGGIGSCGYGADQAAADAARQSSGGGVAGAFDSAIGAGWVPGQAASSIAGAVQSYKTQPAAGAAPAASAGLSAGAKIALGVGAIALLGAGYYFLTGRD